MRNRFSCASQRIFLTQVFEVLVVDIDYREHYVPLPRIDIEVHREVSAPHMFEPWSWNESDLIDEYYARLEDLEEKGVAVTIIGTSEDYLPN